VAVRLLAFGLEAIHDCNPVSKVRAFFERYHARGGYTLVNLCNERDYADSDFPSASGVLRFPSDDHHAPPLAQMVAFCEAVHRILTGAPGPAVRSPVETHALLRTKLSSASLPSIDEAETAALDSPADNMGTLDMLHGAQRLAPEALNPDPNAKPSQRAGDAQATGSAAKDDLVPTILHTSKIAPPELMAPTPVSEVSQLPVASEGMGTCKGDAEYDASHSTEDGSPPATDLPVIATHCKAGKGRTGVMMAAYLMWAAHPECASSDDAIAFFRRMRTTDGDAVVNPSQIRYVRHFASLVQAPLAQRQTFLRGSPIRLLAMSISSAPSASRAAPEDGGGMRGYAGVAASALMGAFMSSSSAWLLQFRVSTVEVRRRPDGVSAHIEPLSATTPCACTCEAGEVLFELAGEGVDISSELLLSLRALGGISSEGEELGWVHIHTSFLEEEQPAYVPAVGSLWRERDVTVRSAAFDKAGVDLVDVDSRFREDWILRIYYIPIG